MTSFVYVPGFLRPQAPIAQNTQPALDTFQPYNNSAGGLGAVLLPPLSTSPDYSQFGVKKDPLDITPNIVTFQFSGSDSTQSGATAFRFTLPGEMAVFQACTINGTRYWEIINRFRPDTDEQTWSFPGALTANTASPYPWTLEFPCALYIVRANIATPPGGATPVTIDILRASTAGTPSVYTNSNDLPTIGSTGTTDLGNPSGLVTFNPGEAIVPKVLTVGTSPTGSTLSLTAIVRRIS